MYRKILPFTAISTLGVGLYACAVGPDFHAPAKPNTDRYTYQKLAKKTISASNTNAGKSQTFVMSKDIPGQWWHIFHSIALNELIQQGLNNSPHLTAAKERLRVAEETLKAQSGALLWPSANLGLGAEKSKIVSLQYGISSPSSIFSIYNTVAQATYNLDIFGGARRQVEYYASQVDYQKYELLATYLSLTSNIVTTAITIASLEAQIKTTLSLIQAETKILQITQKQLALGGVSAEDVDLQQTQLAQTQATLPPLEKMLEEEQHALAVLTGRFTSNAPPLTLTLDQLNLPAQLPVSLPSHLVEQRPDIQAAEAIMHGASAKIGVATANLLPQINLAADFGWVAGAPSALFTPTSNIWDYGASLLQPLFQGGSLLAQRRAAIAQFKQNYADYQQVVLEAFKNVSDALRAIQIDAEEFKAQTIAERSSKRTFHITQLRFQYGGQNYLNVLTSEQQYLKIKLDLIKAKALRFNDTAALFQALGGGWWHQSIVTACKEKSAPQGKTS